MLRKGYFGLIFFLFIIEKKQEKHNFKTILKKQTWIPNTEKIVDRKKDFAANN